MADIDTCNLAPVMVQAERSENNGLVDLQSSSFPPPPSTHGGATPDNVETANHHSNSMSRRMVVVVGHREDGVMQDDDDGTTIQMEDDSISETMNGGDLEEQNGGDSINSAEIVGDDVTLTGESSALNFRLIEAVRNSKCLYDSSHPQYRSADYKIGLWKRLLQSLEFDGDARMLYNRWKQLRDKYGKEKKKVKLGVYPGGVSPWQYFAHLEFLDPFMVDRTHHRFERADDGTLVYKEPPRPVMMTDPSFSFNLVMEVRQRPCLYDTRDPKYKHTEERNQAWSEIIARLNYPGDIICIYKQWKKIRDRYVREKRKLKMTANGDQTEPAWTLFRELQWIDQHLDERAAQVKRRRESSAALSDEMLLSSDGFTSPFPSTSQGSAQKTPTPNNSHRPANSYQFLAEPSGNSQLSSLINHHHQSPSPLTTTTPNNSHVVNTPRGNRLTPNSISSPIPPRAAVPLNGSTPVRTGQGTQLQQSQTSHLRQMQEQIIIPNGLLDGDRAFALSVAADLASLPENARNMARAQIQHLLENSKITIIKAWS